VTELDKLRDIIVVAKSIVFFGGAGVSTASGILDFRGDGLCGIW
jgi:NAD-dependent SIR2 family protein deacetylase